MTKYILTEQEEADIVIPKEQQFFSNISREYFKTWSQHVATASKRLKEYIEKEIGDKETINIYFEKLSTSLYHIRDSVIDIMNGGDGIIEEETESEESWNNGTEEDYSDEEAEEEGEENEETEEEEVLEQEDDVIEPPEDLVMPKYTASQLGSLYPVVKQVQELPKNEKREPIQSNYLSIGRNKKSESLSLEGKKTFTTSFTHAGKQLMADVTYFES